jgi:hypothetical protein
MTRMRLPGRLTGGQKGHRVPGIPVAPPPGSPFVPTPPFVPVFPRLSVSVWVLPVPLPSVCLLPLLSLLLPLSLPLSVPCPVP